MHAREADGDACGNACGAITQGSRRLKRQCICQSLLSPLLPAACQTAGGCSICAPAFLRSSAFPPVSSSTYPVAERPGQSTHSTNTLPHFGKSRTQLSAPPDLVKMPVCSNGSCTRLDDGEKPYRSKVFLNTIASKNPKTPKTIATPRAGHGGYTRGSTPLCSDIRPRWGPRAMCSPSLLFRNKRQETGRRAKGQGGRQGERGEQCSAVLTCVDERVGRGAHRAPLGRLPRREVGQRGQVLQQAQRLAARAQAGYCFERRRYGCKKVGGSGSGCCVRQRARA